jgi:hypothetical protein
MDGQDTISTLFRAISDAEVQANLSDQLRELRQALIDCFQHFRESNISPLTTPQFELRIERIVRETARAFWQWSLNSLETEQTDAMPGTVRYRDKSCRRLFGNITLLRAVYRRGSRDKVIAPLEKALGIERGATPGAMDLVGRQVAAAGYWKDVLRKLYVDGCRIKIERVVDYYHASEGQGR